MHHSGRRASLIFAAEKAFADSAQPLTIVGRVELVPNVPCTNFTCILEGMPIGRRFTNADGIFQLNNLTPALFTLRITCDDTNIPAKRVYAGGGVPSFDVGLIQLSIPGSVSGYLNYDPEDFAQMIVTAPQQGLAVQSNAKGVYLLTGLAPGVRTIRLIMPNGQAIEHKVQVKPGEVTANIDCPSLPPPGVTRKIQDVIGEQGKKGPIKVPTVPPATPH